MFYLKNIHLSVNYLRNMVDKKFFSTIKLTLMMVIPKILALVRDYFILRYFGLSEVSASLTTIIYITQHVGNILVPGIQIISTKGVYGNWQKNSIFYSRVLPLLSLIILITYVHFFYERTISASPSLFLYLAIFLASLSWIRLNESMIGFTTSIYADKTNIPYWSDSLFNILVIFYLYYTTYKPQTFILILILSYEISGYIYKKFTSKAQCIEQNYSLLNKAFVGAIVLTLILSLTIVIDQSLLSRVSIEELSIFNFIHRYTFIIASMSTLFVYRVMGSKIKKIGIREVLQFIKDNSYAIGGLYVLLCVQYIFANNITNFGIPLKTISASVLQLPIYVLFTIAVSTCSKELSLFQKIVLPIFSILLKYLYLFYTGISAQTIFLSHFVLTLSCLILFLVMANSNDLRQQLKKRS